MTVVPRHRIAEAARGDGLGSLRREASAKAQGGDRPHRANRCRRSCAGGVESTRAPIPAVVYAAPSHRRRKSPRLPCSRRDGRSASAVRPAACGAGCAIPRDGRRHRSSRPASRMSRVRRSSWKRPSRGSARPTGRRGPSRNRTPRPTSTIFRSDAPALTSIDTDDLPVYTDEQIEARRRTPRPARRATASARDGGPAAFVHRPVRVQQPHHAALHPRHRRGASAGPGEPQLRRRPRRAAPARPRAVTRRRALRSGRTARLHPVAGSRGRDSRCAAASA